MHVLKMSFILICLFSLTLGASLSSAWAVDPTTSIRDRYSSSAKEKLLSPSGQNRVTKQPPTPEQRLDYLTSKVSSLEQMVATLQSQVTTQAQQIAQLRQIITVNSSGAVTIQAPNALNLSAGSTLNLSASLVDVKAGLSGVHGVLKADTMITNIITSSTYTPGAGNIW